MASINANGYTNRSNANRAAKAAKLESYTIGFSEGKYYVVAAAPAQVAQATPKAVKAAKATKAKAAKTKAIKPAKKTTKAKTKASAADTEILRESSCDNPVKTVWAIADSMKNAKRKDVLAACEAKGIAFYTARTQYQLWKAKFKELAAAKK